MFTGMRHSLNSKCLGGPPGAPNRVTSHHRMNECVIYLREHGIAECDKNDCVHKQSVYLFPLFINEQPIQSVRSFNYYEHAIEVNAPRRCSMLSRHSFPFNSTRKWVRLMDLPFSFLFTE